jgi:hypothetical protein
MKNWEKEFDKNFIAIGGGWLGIIVPSEYDQYKSTEGAIKDFIRSLLQQQKDFFRQTGKQGGESTKKKNPDYSALGKKGATKRWKK